MKMVIPFSLTWTILSRPESSSSANTPSSSSRLKPQTTFAENPIFDLGNDDSFEDNPRNCEEDIEEVSDKFEDRDEEDELEEDELEEDELEEEDNGNSDASEEDDDEEDNSSSDGISEDEEDEDNSSSDDALEEEEDEETESSFFKDVTLSPRRFRGVEDSYQETLVGLLDDFKFMEDVRNRVIEVVSFFIGPEWKSYLRPDLGEGCTSPEMNECWFGSIYPGRCARTRKAVKKRLRLSFSSKGLTMHFQKIAAYISGSITKAQLTKNRSRYVILISFELRLTNSLCYR